MHPTGTLAGDRSPNIPLKHYLRHAGRFSKIILGDQQVALLCDAWRVAKRGADDMQRELTLEFCLPAGDYDWAHLALLIWLHRVVRAAHKDRSIAIAHGLDANLWQEVKIKNTSKTWRVTAKVEWQPRELSEKEFDAIVAKVKIGAIGSDNAAQAEVVNG